MSTFKVVKELLQELSCIAINKHLNIPLADSQGHEDYVSHIFSTRIDPNDLTIDQLTQLGCREIHNLGQFELPEWLKPFVSNQSQVDAYGDDTMYVHKTYATFAIIRDKEGNLLVTTRPEDLKNPLGLPGGKVDQGETTRAALIRECMEEGVDISDCHIEPCRTKVLDHLVIKWYLVEGNYILLDDYKEKHRGITVKSVDVDKAFTLGNHNEFIPDLFDTPPNMREKTKEDPFESYLSRSRSSLVRGDLTDDALANEVFLLPSIGNLTAAKERVRWLSRRLQVAEDTVHTLDSNINLVYKSGLCKE